MLMQEARGRQLLGRLDPELRAQLTPELEDAIGREAAAPGWGTHPVDLRFTLPWFRGGFYIALIAGPERRSAARRRAERRQRRVFSLGNVLLFMAISIAAVLAFSAVFLLTTGVIGA